MSDDPKRLSADPEIDDPALAARLRSDLRAARNAPRSYDVDAGLVRLSAAIGGGPAGGGHDGAGAGGVASGAGALASSGAATTSVGLAVKMGLAGLVALGAAGGAIAVSAPAKTSPSAPSSTTAAPPLPIASSAASIEAPHEAPRSAEPRGAPSSAPIAVAPRASASAPPAASASIKPELDQLALARKALAADPERALALAEEGHARFPRGVFWQEREELAIHALVKLGRAAEAKARARAFVEKHPESPFVEGFRTLSEKE